MRPPLPLLLALLAAGATACADAPTAPGTSPPRPSLTIVPPAGCTNDVQHALHRLSAGYEVFAGPIRGTDVPNDELVATVLEWGLELQAAEVTDLQNAHAAGCPAYVYFETEGFVWQVDDSRAAFDATTRVNAIRPGTYFQNLATFPESAWVSMGTWSANCTTNICWLPNEREVLIPAPLQGLLAAGDSLAVKTYAAVAARNVGTAVTDYAEAAYRYPTEPVLWIFLP